MATLSEHLYGYIDGCKGSLQDDVGVQLAAGRGMFLEDPFSACLMEMDLTSSITEDFMVEEYARVPSPCTPLFITNSTSSLQGEEVKWNGATDAWTHVPACLQQQLFTHYALYLKEIQQVLDMQQDSLDSSSSSVTTSPSSSTPASPALAQVPKMEKRRKSMPSFKVDHYRLHDQVKRIKREDSDYSLEPLSPSNEDPSPFDNNNYNNNNSLSYPMCPDSSTHINSNTPSPISSPRKDLISVAEELASAFLPSVSQIEEEIRAGTSSASAATTVIELTKRPELLTLKQSEAARIMGISTSVLSKRWREATRGKKWPHRIHHKLKRAAIC